MEANFFRFAVEELCHKIHGLRIKKVFIPAQGVWTFSFDNSLNLIFFRASKGGGFFLSQEKPVNPSEPPAQAMLLRKKISNKKIVSCQNLWPWRKMVFELSAVKEFLILDICRGVFIENQISAPETPVDWPGLDEILSSTEIWKTHPHITPPLREALSGMSRDDSSKLLNDLRQGVAQGFFLHQGSKGGEKPGCFLPGNFSGKYRSFESPLEAAMAYGWPIVHGMVTQGYNQSRIVSSQVKRLRRNLVKIDHDRIRLAQMVQEDDFGNLIKSNLHVIDSRVRMKEVILKDAKGIERLIKLDPRRTILENMQLFFKKAAKGRRGLDFIEIRKKELQEKIDGLSDELIVDYPSRTEHPASIDNDRGTISRTMPRFFRSSDGFLILRARNRQSGHKLLSREARPHDLWFHVQDGPGAHVILKRAHELVHVPQKSLEEAANLAALASYRKNDHKALVYCARVKDVRKIKGLEQGRVQVGKVLKSILVIIDPEKESMMEINR
jgi:predicted ribosome quality control (RQC) complex YloA/Tae2 family protein